MPTTRSFRAAALAALALASTIATPLAAQRTRLKLGIEVLLTDSLHLVKGKRVGLITNHTAITALGKNTADLLHAAPGVNLVALFGPEHGIRGEARAGDHVASSIDSATGVPVYSLYGETRVPTAEMLKDVDVLVYDIQDVGSRTYTYPWTLMLSAEAAKKPVLVLDRPNLIRNDLVEGGMLDPKYRSFVGQYPVTTRYGMTIGELAHYLVATGQVKANLTVVPMQNYKPTMWWNETGLPWVNPSPNIRTGDAAVLYTGTVFFEGTNLNEGRGTMMPFQMVGAPWLKAGAVAKMLTAKRIPGVVFDSTSQKVEAGYKYGGETVPVLMVIVADRDLVKPHVVALEMLRAIYVTHKAEFKWRESSIDRLTGDDRVRKAVETDGGIEQLIPILDKEAADFAKAIAPYRIYR